MCGQHWRRWVLDTVSVGGVAAVFWAPPIPQDPTYHAFADGRTFFGTPNFWNVWSNLAFILVGTCGRSRLSRLRSSVLRSEYVVFCSEVVCVGVGSASYHYAPSRSALVRDRLPMTVVFMPFVSVVVHDRLSEPLGLVLLWPLVLVGVTSVGYWHWSELQGRGGSHTKSG